MKKDYIKDIHEDAERRFFNIADNPIEVRADGEKTTVSGIAAVVNKRTSLGWWDEMIMPGAFEGRLNDDIRALFNHDPNYILARSVNGKGTLKLGLDAIGNLTYEYNTPKRSFALDLLDAINTGDVSQSSFAFRVKEQAWEFAPKGTKQNDLRKIVRVEQLYDVSPVTYPAYPDASVGARSMEAIRKELETKDLVDYKLSLAKRKLQLL
jgi:HK97 family phage prohead protease